MVCSLAATLVSALVLFSAVAETTASSLTVDCPDGDCRAGDDETALLQKFAFIQSRQGRRDQCDWRHENFALNEVAPRYVVLAHHKTSSTYYDDIVGSMLSDMAAILGMTCSWWDYACSNKFSSCLPDQVTLYANTHTNDTRDLLSAFPDIRAVHLVRRSLSIVASEYVHSKYDFQNDLHSIPHDEDLGFEVRNHSLSWGIQRVCQYVLPLVRHIPPIHDYLQSEGFNNVLEVRLEDFDRAYESTTRSIFEHFLGNDDPRIDRLVTSADLARTSTPSPNVVSADMQAEADLEIKRQLEAQDPCIQALVEMDGRMGYSDDFAF